MKPTKSLPKRDVSNKEYNQVIKEIKSLTKDKVLSLSEKRIREKLPKKLMEECLLMTKDTIEIGYTICLITSDLKVILNDIREKTNKKQLKLW